MLDHTLSSFDERLGAIGVETQTMAMLASTAVKSALDALMSGDADVARGIVGGDSKIDAMQHTIEQMAVLAIAKNQPMAIDLRELVAAMRVASDLERIGDLAKNIAKRTIAIGKLPRRTELLASIGQLAALVVAQLDRIVAAYERRDDESAIAVREGDASIDAAHTVVFRDLLTYMLEDPRGITICTHLLFCAKNIERIGDHVTNIAETIHYIRTGEILDDDRIKADESSTAVA